jgi:hypothetical protein
VRVKTQSFDPRTGVRGEWREYALSDDRKRDAIINGLKGLTLTGSRELEARLDGFISGDPDYKVREAALKLKENLPEIRKRLAGAAAAPASAPPASAAAP